MGIKKLLTVATMLVAGALGINAQNIIANWDGGSNTGKPTEFGWESSNSDRSWGSLNGSGARVSTTYSSYELENGDAYSYDENSELSSKILWIRYNNKNQKEIYTYTFQGLKPLHCYDFSGLVGWHNNDSYPTFTITVKGADGSEFATVQSSKITLRETLYKLETGFMVPEYDENTDYKL